MNVPGDGGPQQRIVVVQAQPQPPGSPGPSYQVMMDPRPGSAMPQPPGNPGFTYQVSTGPRPVAVPPGGPGPMPAQRLREYAEQLRLSAREAQELADRLRRQADELDLMAMRQMNRGPRSQNGQNMEPIQRELGELQGAIGRAEQEGRWQDAAELRQRADQLKRSPQGAQPGPGMVGPEEMKRQIERLRDEAARAKQEGRIEDSQRVWKEADRMEQQLRGQGPGPKGGFSKPVPPPVQDILRAAEQAEREGRMEDARKQREKAEAVARQLEEQQRGQGNQQMGPRGDERQGIKEKIGRLRDEAQKAKEQGRFDDANRMWKDADRLEQQLREQGQGPKQPGPQLRDELKRSMEEVKKEIGRLWQAVNEMRSRSQEGRPS
jgi:hypothetical protein